MNENSRHAVHAALAASQAVILTWLATAVVVIFAFTINISSPVLTGVSWQDAGHMATSLWMLSLGSPLIVSGAHISLMPLLLTLGIALAFRYFIRRNSIGGWNEVVGAACAAAALTAVISLSALPGTFTLHGILGAGILAAVVSLIEWWSWDPPRAAWWGCMARSWALAKPLLMVLISATFVLFIVAMVTGWDQVLDIHSYYLLNALQSGVFTVAQALYLPTLLVWTLAFASGAGFTVGSGTHFSSLGVMTQPLPALPVLGALPGPTVHMPWLIVIIVACGLAVGVLSGGHLKRLGEACGAGAIATMVLMVLFALVGALSTGGIGPGRLIETGVEPPIFGALVALEAGGGLLLGLLLRNQQLHGIIRARFRGAAASPSTGGATDPEDERAAEVSEDLAMSGRAAVPNGKPEGTDKRTDNGGEAAPRIDEPSEPISRVSDDDADFDEPMAHSDNATARSDLAKRNSAEDGELSAAEKWRISRGLPVIDQSDAV